MVARTLFLIAVSAVVIAGFVFLAPLDVVLAARGYDSEQIAAMKVATEPQPQTPCTPRNGQAPAANPADSDSAESSSAAPENAQTSGQNSAPEPAAAEPEPEPAQKFAATGTINVRAGQGTNFDVVGQFDPNQVVTLVEDTDGDWMQVKGGSVTGWVYKPLFEER